MRTGHQALFDDAGAVLRFVPVERPGTPIADLADLPPGRRAVDAAAAAATQLPGWLIRTEDLALAAALIKAGGRPTRHAWTMQCDLRRAPAPAPMPAVPGLRPVGIDGQTPQSTWCALLPAWRAAYPPEHPDHFDGDDAEALAVLCRLAEGLEVGPMHDSSTLVLDRTGRPLAGVLVTVLPPGPSRGGPWVADIWREPGLRGTGVGAWLIGRVQTALSTSGHVSLGLAVSTGNPARRTYDTTGFRVVSEWQTVQVPMRTPDVTFPSGP